MKNSMKKRRAAIIAVVFAVSMLLSTAAAFASEDQGYLALGADLSDAEKSTVLQLMGISSTDGYNVITVTNSEEHKYLDSYISYSEIGTKALSSVLIKEKSGDEIDVETKNINYCTTGMYRNALATAGVSGADVTVAGPFEISGTAALVGTIKAYEEMSGETVSDDVIESSVDELTTTGEVGESIGDTEKAEAIVATVKEDLADNPNMSDSEIEEAVRDAAGDAGVDMSEENVKDVSEMLQNLQDSDIDWDNVKRQSESILENFKDIFNSEEAQGLFSRFIEWIKSLL